MLAACPDEEEFVGQAALSNCPGDLIALLQVGLGIDLRNVCLRMAEHHLGSFQTKVTSDPRSEGVPQPIGAPPLYLGLLAPSVNGFPVGWR